MWARACSRKDSFVSWRQWGGREGRKRKQCASLIKSKTGGSDWGWGFVWVCFPSPNSFLLSLSDLTATFRLDSSRKCRTIYWVTVNLPFLARYTGLFLRMVCVCVVYQKKEENLKCFIKHPYGNRTPPQFLAIGRGVRTYSYVLVSWHLKGISSSSSKEGKT